LSFHCNNGCYTSIAHLVITFMSFSTLFIRSWNSYALIWGLPLWRVTTIMFYSRTPYNSLLYVRAIDYYINKYWPRTLSHAKQHCTAIHPRCSHTHQTTTWRGLRERLSSDHYLEFNLLLLQFEQTQAHNSIKVTILQNTRCYTFQASLIHHQEAYSCTNICLKLSARSSADENPSLFNLYRPSFSLVFVPTVRCVS